MAEINRNKQHTWERKLNHNQGPKKPKQHTIFWSNPRTEDFFHVSKDVRVFSSGDIRINRSDEIADNIGMLSSCAGVFIPNDRDEPIEVKANCAATELIVQATSTNNTATFIYNLDDQYNTYTHHGLLDWKLKSVSHFNKSFASINGSFITSVNTEPRVLYLGGYFDIETHTMHCGDFLWKLSIPLITLQNAFPEMVGDQFFSTGKAGANLMFNIPDTLGASQSGWVVMRCEFPKKPDGSGTFAIVGNLTQ